MITAYDMVLNWYSGLSDHVEDHDVVDMEEFRQQIIREVLNAVSEWGDELADGVAEQFGVTR